MRRGGRAAEGPALEKRYPGQNRDRGFESHPLRQHQAPHVNGEMSELAEGARLEIVCAVKSGTEGSNPSLSAIFFLESPPAEAPSRRDAM